MYQADPKLMIKWFLFPIYTKNKAEEDFCLFERANFWSYQSDLKKSFAFDNPILVEGYNRLFKITLRPINAEQKEK